MEFTLPRCEFMNYDAARYRHAFGLEGTGTIFPRSFDAVDVHLVLWRKGGGLFGKAIENPY